MFLLRMFDFSKNRDQLHAVPQSSLSWLGINCYDSTDAMYATTSVISAVLTP